MRFHNATAVFGLVLLCAATAFGGGSGDVPASLRNSGYNPSAMRNVRGPEGAVGNLRPWVASDHGRSVSVENIYAHDMTNDAIHISAQSYEKTSSNGQPLTYGAVAVRNCEIANIWIPPGSGRHSDALQITGAVDLSRGVHRPSLTIHNVYIHDTGSGSMTCLTQGWWDTVVLRNVQMVRTYSDIKLGYARRIVIENCPGANIGIYGPPGTTGEVLVINSPGAQVRNMLRNGQSPNAPIRWDNSGRSPAPLPAYTPPAAKPTPAAKPAPSTPSTPSTPSVSGVGAIRFHQFAGASGGMKIKDFSEGGRALSYVRAGYWAEFALTLPQTRAYTFLFRHASAALGGKIRIEVDGKLVTGDISVSRTGGWDRWATGSKGGIRLSAGKHIIRILFSRNSTSRYVGNFTWFKFQ